MEGDWGERVVQKMVGGIRSPCWAPDGLPSLFPAFALFSLPSSFLFAPATKANTSLPNYLTPTGKCNPTS